MLLARTEENPVLFEHKGRIVQSLARPAPALEHAEDTGNALKTMNQLSQGLVVRVQKSGALQQILGRIAAQGQFGKDDEIAAGLPGRFHAVEDFLQIACKVADNRVGLHKSYFHGGQDPGEKEMKERVPAQRPAGQGAHTAAEEV